MNKTLEAADFIAKAVEFPVVDVRSPGEFAHGHIPGAHNIPLFDDAERARVGTTYKKVGRQAAIKIGLEIVGPKLSAFVSKAEELCDQQQRSLPPADCGLPTVLVHCWRGGMRSANFAWLLNLNGINTFTLNKGYKAYRNFVLNSFNRESNLVILGGSTGSGKTDILQKIAQRGEQVVDLEALAHHKGSSFGAIGQEPQPVQENFENRLAAIWNKLDHSKGIWLEDEAKSIGKIFLPENLWAKMKEAPIIRINVPKTERIKRLVADYGRADKKLLAGAIVRITKRLGHEQAQNALDELEKGNLAHVADITLAYYDKAYDFNHEKREWKNVFAIDVQKDEPEATAILAISKAKELSAQLV